MAKISQPSKVLLIPGSSINDLADWHTHPKSTLSSNAKGNSKCDSFQIYCLHSASIQPASGCRDLSWSGHILMAYIDTLCLLGFYLTTFKPTGVWSDQVNLCISEREPDSYLKISFGLPSWCLMPRTNEWFPYSFNIHITGIHTNNSHD